MLLFRFPTGSPRSVPRRLRLLKRPRNRSGSTKCSKSPRILGRTLRRGSMPQRPREPAEEAPPQTQEVPSPSDSSKQPTGTSSILSGVYGQEEELRRSMCAREDGFPIRIPDIDQPKTRVQHCTIHGGGRLGAHLFGLGERDIWSRRESTPGVGRPPYGSRVSISP